jgi:hypothetical protein
LVANEKSGSELTTYEVRLLIGSNWFSSDSNS